MENDVHLGGIRVGTEAGDLHRGWIWRDGASRSVRRWDVRTELAPDGLTHGALELRVTDKEGDSHRFDGTILRCIPLGSAETGRIRVLEGLAHWRHEGRDGYGIAEYAHLLGSDGRPAVPVD